MPTTRDLDSSHLAFRRLVGVLVRCQSPSVASHLNIWSGSRVESSAGEGLRAAAGLAPTFLHSLMGEGAEITEDFTQVGTNLPRVEEEKGEGEIRAEPLIPPTFIVRGARMEA